MLYHNRRPFTDVAVSPLVVGRYNVHTRNIIIPYKSISKTIIITVGRPISRLIEGRNHNQTVILLYCRIMYALQRNS